MKKLGWIASICCYLIVGVPTAGVAYPLLKTSLTTPNNSPATQTNLVSQLKKSPQLETPSVQPAATSTNATAPKTPATASEAITTETAPSQVTVLPIGINVGDRAVVDSVLVRGQEDGEKAVDFTNWLVPYDTVIQTLKFSATNLPDGQIQLRSPGLVTRINPAKIRTDAELGLVFSIQDIETLFGVKAQFDISQYAIVFQVPWFSLNSETSQPDELPVILDGLPQINAPNFNLSGIQQRVNVSSAGASSLNTQGELTAVGTLLGGSGFIQLNQDELGNQKTWTIREAQFLRQTDRADYVLGSQPPFWLNQGSGDYVGITTIRRRGFIPPKQLYGESDPRQRLQSSQLNRTISGRAEPGTLVRLTQKLSDRPISEVLVDSSGIYRFDNVPSGGQFLGGSYRVLLYPKGQLTAQPEIKDVALSSTPGQLPVGASALIVSGGWRRELSSSTGVGLLGNFSDFRGGVAQRWGVSESLTVGLGAVYDQSLRGFGEVFYKPQSFPIEAAISILSGGDGWNINSDIRFDPSPSLSARFNSDRFSSRFNVNWEVFPNFTLLSIVDSKDSPTAGVQFNSRGKNSSTSVRATIDTQSRFRWDLSQQLGRLNLNGSGSEIGIRSQLTYDLSGNQSRSSNQALILSYETRNQKSDKLAVLGYRYRSPQRTFAGDSILEAELGYGFGSRGSGIVATVGTTILPGVLLRARYQGVSVTSDESTFNLELVPTLNFQQGIRRGDRRINYLRTQGGLLIQPFLDSNNNGQRDADEEFYTEPDLILLNNKPINSLRPEVRKDRILIFLPPDTYRLDLDPAGYPPDAQPINDAYAVKVAAGTYTPISVPLIISFTRSGIITDAQGKPINGAKVEAVSKSSGQRVFSITNEAGVYYLERLQQGTYSLLINGKPAQSNTITLDKASEPFQELNLKQL